MKNYRCWFARKNLVWGRTVKTPNPVPCINAKLSFPLGLLLMNQPNKITTILLTWHTFLTPKVCVTTGRPQRDGRLSHRRWLIILHWHGKSPWYERAHLSSNWLQVRLQLGLFQVCICFSRWNPSEEVPTTSENFLPFKITGLLFKAIRLNCREWGAGETHYTSTRLHRLGGGDVKEENSLSCHSHRIQIWVHSTRYYDGLMRNARQTSQLPQLRAYR